MSDSLIQFPAMASGASFAGTCLMHTMMFTRGFLFRAISAWTQTLDHAELGSFASLRMTYARERVSLAGPTPENQCGVSAAEAKRIRKDVFDRRLARVIRHVIQIAFRIGGLVIDGGRQRLI